MKVKVRNSKSANNLYNSIVEVTNFMFNSNELSSLLLTKKDMNSSINQRIDRMPKVYKIKADEDLSELLRRDNGVLDGNTALELLLKSFKLPRQIGQKNFEIFLENLKEIIFSLPNENELYSEKIFGV